MIVGVILTSTDLSYDGKSYKQANRNPNYQYKSVIQGVPLLLDTFNRGVLIES